MNESDPYRDLDYHRLFAWPERLRKEGPFLLEVLGRGPDRRVLDLGCGPGVHAAWLGAQGFTAVGVDRSEQQIATARAEYPQAEFLCASITELSKSELAVREPFGGAICVGNVLPSLDDAALSAMLDGVHGLLAQSGVLLLHLLDYGPIRAGERRFVAPRLSAGAEEGEETAFVRFFAPSTRPGHVRFLPTTLTLPAGDDQAVRLRKAEAVVHRAWVLDEVRPALEAAGFGTVETFGDLQGRAFGEGGDLVLVARRL